MYSSHALLLCSSTCLCAHPYCIPALACAHLYYVQAISGCNSINSQHFPPCASLLYSSIACVHFYYVQALSCMHFYVRVPTAFRHCLRAFLLLSSTLCMHLKQHFYRNLSIRTAQYRTVRKVLERSRNACTQCWNAAGTLCASLLYSGTVCVHFYYFRALFACIFIGISVFGISVFSTLLGCQKSA